MVSRSKCSTEQAEEGVWAEMQVKRVSSFGSAPPQQSSIEQIWAVEYSLPLGAFSHFHLH